MTFRIDRTKRAVSARSASKAELDSHAETSASRELVIVPAEPTSYAPRPDRRDAEAAFEAQRLGQDGQKRGLRAGQGFIDQARSAYARVEWSGAYDRRRNAGRTARAVA